VSLFDVLPFDLGEAEGGEAAPKPEPDPSLDDAVAAAEHAGVAVVFVQDSVTEGTDREDLSLPGEQDALVERVAAVADRTVVVVNSSGPVEMPWRTDVDAILEGWYPGQAHGDAVAAVLYGDTDPAGRLPVTFARTDDYPTADRRRHPGVDDRAAYDEGLFVGYRHFDADGPEPLYPFGHGESYTTFEYGTATTVDDATVRVTVENVGDREGREVVQAYVRPPAVDGVDRPPRELAGFASVAIPPGDARTVEVSLDEKALGRYDETAGWTVDPGTYTVEVGRSVADVRTTTTVER
jgi:beta-glucosidase